MYSVHATLLLDRSGSMSCIKQKVIEKTNDFIKEQKELDGKMTCSAYQFDTEFETLFENIDIQKVPFLTDESYEPRGMTALLDSIAETINRTGDFLREMKKKNRPDKVVVIIQTDGLENSSKEYTCEAIMKMIKHQEDKYNWQFVFLGANQDAIASGGSLGISAVRSVTYAHTNQGYEAVYNMTSQKVTNLRTSGCAISFTDEDREKVMDGADTDG